MLFKRKLEYNREKIIEFKKELETKSTSMSSPGHEEDAGGFGGFGAGASTAKKATQADANVASDNDQAQSKAQRLAGLKPLWHNKEKMSSLMMQNAKIVEVRLNFEQKQILQRIHEKISIFDGELKILRHERSQVAKVLKNIDLRHVTLYEEFMLLRDFEKTENELEQKKEKKREENVEMLGKISEIQLKIDAKKKDIEKLDEQQKQLTETYYQMTKSETKFADFLTKVYKRKIKRKKKLEGEEVDEESEEESDDDEDEDEDEDFDEDDSEAEGREQLDLDICPNGLAQTLYDDVCKLRENRLDLEEKIAEEKKIAEQFKKDQESLTKKLKVTENGFKQAQKELENFQMEKQKKINDLDIVATMNFNQIQMMDKGYLPADLTRALVFDSRNLDNLQNRIKELQIEKINEKKRFKTLKERNIELVRDRRKMQEYIERLEETSKKMMTDKFGKEVDLEKLELIAVNQQIEELKQKLAENEFEHDKLMQEWLAKINTQKDESIELLKTNTSRLNEVVDLLKEKKSVEKFLNLTQKSLVI
jgi:cilia- and flagella-associated protein 44